MEWELSIVLILIVLGFMAAFIDAVVGGGGLISTPALLAVGLPPAMALGTNKLASTFGALTGAFQFLRARKVDVRYTLKRFPFVFIAAALGAYMATLLPNALLKPLIIFILIAVLFYTLLKKDWGEVRQLRVLSPMHFICFSALLFMIGFYDGFLGAGTGSFMLFVFLMLGFDFLSAAGNAKVLNFASNLGALVVFMYLGQVNYLYGIVMALSMIVGAAFGAQFAIRRGVHYVKWLFVIVTSSLILKSIYDIVLNFIK